MLGGVFISYRREDTAGFARLIYDRLTNKLGRDSVFFDVDNIPVGLDFVDILSERVGKCYALIAVIGKNWVSSADIHDRRRLDDPNDFVRIEIEAALERKIRVIPVLVDGAPMPQPGDLPDSLKKLVRRQGIEISHTRFDSDVERLTRALMPLEEELRQREAAEAERRARVERERREATETARKAEEAQRLAQAEAQRVDEERRAAEAAEAERAAKEQQEKREGAAAEKAEQARRLAEAEAQRAEKKRRPREAAEAERRPRVERERREATEAAEKAEQARRLAEAEAQRAEKKRRAREAAEAERRAQVERERREATEAAEKAEEAQRLAQAEVQRADEERRAAEAAEAERAANQQQEKREAAEAAAEAERRARAERERREATEAAEKAEEAQRLAQAEAARGADEERRELQAVEEREKLHASEQAGKRPSVMAAESSWLCGVAWLGVGPHVQNAGSPTRPTEPIDRRSGHGGGRRRGCDAPARVRSATPAGRGRAEWDIGAERQAGRAGHHLPGRAGPQRHKGEQRRSDRATDRCRPLKFANPTAAIAGTAAS